MERHAGTTIEKAVRRSGISIAELARRVEVNRRSIYNWFEQGALATEIIAKIGYAIAYDFSKDFPELLTNQKYIQMKHWFDPHENLSQDISYWKNKYITLLEKYNNLLIKQNSDSDSEESAA